MRRFFFTILSAALISAPAIAQKAPVRQDPIAAINPNGLTVNDCINILNGLMALDRPKEGGSSVPLYEFTSSAFRLDVAHNLAVLSAAHNIAQQAQQKIRADVLRTLPPTEPAAAPPEGAPPRPAAPPKPATEIPPDSPQAAEFERRSRELTQQPCAPSVIRINASDLNLDKNPIPLGVLSLLDPILNR